MLVMRQGDWIANARSTWLKKNSPLKTYAAVVYKFHVEEAVVTDKSLPLTRRRNHDTQFLYTHLSLRDSSLGAFTSISATFLLL